MVKKGFKKLETFEDTIKGAFNWISSGGAPG